MVLIVHISDLHLSHSDFNENMFLKAVDEINDLNPDMIILTGDLTDHGYYSEFLQIKDFLKMFNSSLFAIPGNHDAKNIGYKTFEELIGDRSWKLTKDDENLVMLGLDSTTPDLSQGNIGRLQQAWMENELNNCMVDNKFSIVAMHHHIIPIPGTGRERNILTDAGDILQSLISHEVDIVIGGHKHVPHLWQMDHTLFVNAGSLSSYKLRGKETNSYNIIQISENNIEIYLNKLDGNKILLGNFKRNVI
ncbi:metallophosphoesterase [uncultured Methanobrevibacter sp.]|uniref:metallophosphoesterase family protein n=1 Tax=uncultured Methanobrevibacter sp. TaxID=253161 RepID=UPI0025E70A1B|nr:metallophosphoesterase [uncultured Methanobrevibacter sp.]